MVLACVSGGAGQSYGAEAIQLLRRLNRQVLNGFIPRTRQDNSERPKNLAAELHNRIVGQCVVTPDSAIGVEWGADFRTGAYPAFGHPLIRY